MVRSQLVCSGPLAAGLAQPPRAPTRPAHASRQQARVVNARGMMPRACTTHWSRVKWPYAWRKRSCVRRQMPAMDCGGVRLPGDDV